MLTHARERNERSCDLGHLQEDARIGVSACTWANSKKQKGTSLHRHVLNIWSAARALHVTNGVVCISVLASHALAAFKVPV